MRIEYFLDEFVDILKKRDYSRLGFHKLDNGYPYAYCFLYTTGTSAHEDEAFANGTPDKIAGAALFIFPLVFKLIDVTLFAAALCVITTAAAINESKCVLRNTS